MSSNASRRPIAIDIFSGVGGLSLGFEQAGFDLVAAVEYDPIHAIVHKYNFPDCEIVCRDVTRVGAEQVLSAAQKGFSRLQPGVVWPGQIDALIGGPSCQGFSTGGVRDANDERNDLLLHFVRLVEEIRPLTFCFENVPGLLEPRFEELRTIAFKRLANAGYSMEGESGWLNAADFGVPQNRRRVLVVGSRGGTAPQLPTPPYTRITVGDAFQGLPVVEDYDSLLHNDVAELRGQDLRNRSNVMSPYAAALASESAARTERQLPPTYALELSNCLRTEHSETVTERFRATSPGSVEPVSRFYRLDLDSQARTLRAGTGRERGAHTSPRPIHPSLPRVITVREAARLHSYPDWFRFNSTNWHGHRQIGNSVPPLLARAVAERLMGHLQPGVELSARSVSGLGTERWRHLPPAEAGRLLEAVPSDLPPQRSRTR